MPNLSATLTKPQCYNRTKTVTRRRGWRNLKVGTVLTIVEKGQGLKKGEKAVVICKVRVTSVRRERLDRMITEPAYGRIEAKLEGFPGMTGREFVEMFCRHMKVTPDTVITRIAWVYL